MRPIKSTLTLCLCLTLLITSATGAFARGQMAFGQTVVICAGGEASLITLDARGNPIDAARSCPECFAVTAGLPPVPVALAAPANRWQRLANPVPMQWAVQVAVHVFARGPPVLI
jgi:hypothetical protein